jgi:hypothetical protein
MDITDRRFAFTFWTLDITMFGVIAGYNNALVGAAVVDFSDTGSVIAVHDAFWAGAMWNVEEEVRMRTGWK